MIVMMTPMHAQPTCTVYSWGTTS